MKQSFRFNQFTYDPRTDLGSGLNMLALAQDLCTKCNVKEPLEVVLKGSDVSYKRGEVMDAVLDELGPWACRALDEAFPNSNFLNAGEVLQYFARNHGERLTLS